MKPQTLHWTVKFIDGREENVTIPDEEYDSEDHITETIAMTSSRPDDVDDCWPFLVLVPQHDTTTALREALNDLWGCIGVQEIAHLQPETIRIAAENHNIICHKGRK